MSFVALGVRSTILSTLQWVHGAEVTYEAASLCSREALGELTLTTWTPLAADISRCSSFTFFKFVISLSLFVLRVCVCIVVCLHNPIKRYIKVKCFFNFLYYITAIIHQKKRNFWHCVCLRWCCSKAVWVFVLLGTQNDTMYKFSIEWCQILWRTKQQLFNQLSQFHLNASATNWIISFYL